jgi:dolichol-phosphate mannosyltransferase
MGNRRHSKYDNPMPIENSVRRNKLSAIICCYRDEGNIPVMYDRLTKLLQETTSDYEIIFVNDASPDNSEHVLRDIAAKDPHVTVMLQSRNFGAQAAFTAGMVQAIGDAVILLDGDLQDPPELIPEFVKKWNEGFDVVYGVRRKREKSMGS